MFCSAKTYVQPSEAKVEQIDTLLGIGVSSKTSWITEVTCALPTSHPPKEGEHMKS